MKVISGQQAGQKDGNCEYAQHMQCTQSRTHLNIIFCIHKMYTNKIFIKTEIK